MGKKGNNNKKTSAAAKAAPRCECADLYRCNCGNRPERPSKGHKWDPETQQWGGKGHKQKGASGQTSTVASAAKVTDVGKTKISEWQKLPSNLLNAFCTKEKRPFPKYKSLDSCKAGHFKYRVIIQDAKVTKRGGDHDMIFVPAAEVQNEEQAREEAALLALLHLTPTIPHERTLPDPYKTTWTNALLSMKEAKQSNQKVKAASRKDETTGKDSKDNQNVISSDETTNTQIAAAKTSSNLVQGNNYISLADRRKKEDAKKKERNAKIRKHEAFRMANKDAQVFMSAKMRKQIESFLRGDVDEKLLNALMSDTNLSDEDGDEEEDNIVKSYIIERLSHEGFTKSQAKTSYKAILKNTLSLSTPSDEVNLDQSMDNVYEKCLQWLCVHLNEDQLPEGFDPRGRTLDVVMPIKKENDKEEVNTHVKELTELFGLSMLEAKLLSQSATNKSLSIRILLQKALLDANNLTMYSNDTKDNLSSIDRERNITLAKDEIEVLQSMFVTGEDLHIKKDREKVDLIIYINDQNDVKRKLRITYNQNTYPQSHPIVFVEGGWKEGFGSMFHINMVKFIHSLPKEEPMVFEIFGYVQEHLLTDCDPFAIEKSLIPYLEGGSVYLTSNTTVKPIHKKALNTNGKISSSKSTQMELKLRPREKSFFWSKSPSQVPAATVFPHISKSMAISRQRLPAAKARDEFIQIMKMSDSINGVVLVTGETGCGKTTQIPQFILEEAPESAKIVVAQPRRLAATGVADRVAKERGEEKPGIGSVGYVVRGDVAMCNSTRLMFCTTGVLLRQLQSEGALDCITHIVIDEVHERHLDTDILLGILKESKPKHLRVVLMSATMDADRFAAFWGRDTPRMHIPGYTHPVKDFTLEDVITLTGYVPSKKRKKHCNKGRVGYKKQATPWAYSEFSDDEKNEDSSAEIEEDKPVLSHSNKKSLPLPVEELVKRCGDEVDYDLIATLVRHLLSTKESSDDGSILVFLPGANEIMKAQDTILRVTKGVGLNILPLHGGLQPKDQQRVFQSTKPGVTKIILSTNVAETSITIPDCTIVIDTCKEKQSSYDPSNRMPLLIETFSSQDSLKQRRGRAGRVRSGSCYKLISKHKFEKLSEHGEPEIKRCALDQTLLTLLFLGIEQGSGNFLSRLLDPPSQQAIDAAIYSLEKLGAVTVVPQDRNISITPLGVHLTAIPAPPRIGKMLVFGEMLGCRSTSLAIAASMSIGKSPFLRIDSTKNNRYAVGDDIDDEKQERKIQNILDERRKLFESVGNSDLALLAAAYMQWDDMNGGNGDKRRFCESIGLSINSMREMKRMVNQLDSALTAAGFKRGSDSNKHIKSGRIVRSCIVAALSPSQIVRVQRSSIKYTETVEGAIKKDGEAKELQFYTRSDNKSNIISVDKRLNTIYHGVSEERVFIHPSSANFSVGDYSCPWIVYHELVRTSKPFLRDANECNIYDLLLFGGNLQVSSSDGIIVIDGYVRLSANARIGALIGGLRQKIDEMLSQKVANPSLDVANSVEMKLISKLLRSDGFGGS